MTCWLGGTFGAGCLMLYAGDQALWSSGEGKWAYDREYVLFAETRPGEARVRLLEADGTTAIAESPFVPVPRELSDSPGLAGFHTWKGPAEFWGFAEDGADLALVAREVSEALSPKAVSIGGGWAGDPAGWEFHDAGPELLHRGEGKGRIHAASIQGGKGTWRMDARPRERATASLLFQVSPDGKEGFALRLAEEGGKVSARLETLDGKSLWTSEPIDHSRGLAYGLEGRVLADRVRTRLLAPDGKVLADSGDIYVRRESHERTGMLSLEATGRVTITRWGFTREE
jgi:hypothetical protein